MNKARRASSSKKYETNKKRGDSRKKKRKNDEQNSKKRPPSLKMYNLLQKKHQEIITFIKLLEIIQTWNSLSRKIRKEVSFNMFKGFNQVERWSESNKEVNKSNHALKRIVKFLVFNNYKMTKISGTHVSMVFGSKVCLNYIDFLFLLLLFVEVRLDPEERCTCILVRAVYCTLGILPIKT